MWSFGQTAPTSVIQRMAVCQNCGKENPSQASVCTDCGSPLPAAKRANLAGTMLGMPSPVLSATSPSAAAKPPGASSTAEPPAPARPFAGTMMGMPSPLAPGGGHPKAGEAASPTPSPAATSPSPGGKSAALGRTMVGMGTPAQPLAPAPISPGPATPTEPVLAPIAPEPAPQNRKFQGTLLGVARPGIAPSQFNAPAPPSAAALLPVRPADPQAPSPAEVPFSSERVDKPFPITRPAWKSVAMIVGAVAGAAALGGLFAVLSPKPVTVIVEEFSIDEDGNDQLKLKCDECPEGSKLVLGGVETPVRNKAALLTPPHPLALGRNELEFTLKMNGESRDVKKVILPIAFRVLTKWTGLHEDPPFAEINVLAPDGSKVLIGGKEAPIQAQKAVRRIEFSAETSGEASKVTSIDSSFDVVVTVDGKERQTKAELKNGVAPLTLTSPAPIHQLGGKPVAVSGRTAPGAKVKIGSTEVQADDKGAFSHIIESPTAGKLAVTVSTDKFLSRRVEVELSGDAPRPPSAVSKFSEIEPGAFVNLKANVIESRTAGGTTQALVEVETGCDAPPCLLRAVYGEPKKLPPNRTIALTGTVAGGNPLTVRVTRFR